MSLNRLKGGLMFSGAFGAECYAARNIAKTLDAPRPIFKVDGFYIEPREGHPDKGECKLFDAQVEVPADRLALDERGLVLSPPLRKIDEILQTGGSLDPQELRFALLFWDRLSKPIDNREPFEPSPDEQFLMDCGFLSHPVVRYSTKTAENDLIDPLTLSFTAYDNIEPGLWSLGRTEGAQSSNQKIKSGQGVLFSLFEAIPVPDKNVPLAELLEFKSKRRSELLNLRHELERIYQTILSAADIDRSFSTELSALDKAIANHLKVSRESGLKFKLSGFSAKLDYKTWAAAGVAFTASQSQSLPLTASLFAGVAGGAIASISATATIERKAKVVTPFEYISRFHRDIF